MAKVLIIEDNPANLELMAYLLASFGHSYLSAYDAEQGIALAHSEAPDLIICDIHLPGADGFAVAAALKADATLGATPLVAVTALAMVGDRERGLAAGFDGYLSKPIDPRLFVSQVESWLSNDKRGKALPVAAQPSSLAATSPSACVGRILVVDDSEVNRDLIRATLTPVGYDIVLAQNVVEALTMARQSPPDMILSDIHMPGDSGFDLIRQVRADAALSRLPFLFISSSVWGEQDRSHALQLGVTEFILRPVEPHVLLLRVARFLSTGGAGCGEDPGC